MTASPAVEVPDERPDLVAALKAARENRRQIDRHITRMEKRLAALGGARGRSRELDPHTQAGPKNVSLMEDTFRRLRTASVAEATRAAGSEPGHQTWAIRALEADGAIVRTGKKRGVSVEYRYVPRARRVTTLKPGE